MPFITNATQKEICQNIDIKRLGNYPTDDLYKINLSSFSENERIWLAAAKMLFEDPAMFIQYAYRKKEKPTDSGTKVYAERQKAYHDNNKCIYLNSEYLNFDIPPEISGQEGQPRVEEFRTWFLGNILLLQESESKFLKRMETYFRLANPPKLNQISKNNSGVEDFDSYDLETMEEKINSKILELKEIRTRDDRYGDAIRQFGHLSHTKQNGHEIDSHLREWKKDKGALKRMLLAYFRVKFNKELEFEGYLLEQLGLKKCSACTK